MWVKSKFCVNKVAIIWVASAVALAGRIGGAMIVNNDLMLIHDAECHAIFCFCFVTNGIICTRMN